MDGMRRLAVASVTACTVSLFSLVLVMMALTDIYHAREPSLVTEWNIVRAGFCVFWVSHIITLLSGLSVLRLKRGAALAAAAPELRR
ncbi:MAG: hypothetical protein GF331_20990 [Chitinivibrionales bacterium]|nr:hypothetical protein [Chitinivibrionales bacterium]